MNNSYKKKILTVSLVAVMIALLCVMLSACGLFKALREVTKADIVVESGLEEGEDGYITTIGTEFTLSVDWHNKRVVSPAIAWHIKCEEQDETVADTKTISYTFNRSDVGHTYVFYAVVNDSITTDEIKITPQIAPLSDPVISSSTHNITGGQIQQNRAEEISDVSLTVSWNKDYIDEDLQIDVNWYANGTSVSQEETYVYVVSDITRDCTIEILVEIGYTTQDDSVTKSASITLSFVSHYEVAQSVKITPSEDGGKLQRLSEGHYYLQSDADDASVSFTTLLYPDKAKQDAYCTWTVYSGDTKNILDDDGRSAQIPLNQGKNVIKASIQNVESRQIIVYVFPTAYSELTDEIKASIDNKFVWDGNNCDAFISSQRDLNAYVSYAVSKHKIDVAYDMYLAVDSWRNIDVFKEKCAAAMSNIDESGSFVYSATIEGVEGTIKYMQDTVFGIPSGKHESSVQVNQARAYVRYEEQNGTRATLPVDSYTELVVEDSNALYRAVSNGYKPKFEGENATALSALYQKARDVLTKYITDDMSDLQKVAVIYDWIVYEISYDYEVAQSSVGASGSGYNAFYLEGVFNDGMAVCDGKSKAFALLCGMEGIKALRIRGYANAELSSLTEEQKAKAGHAWNKVLLDANGDGVKEWYVVDTTWGDASVKTSENPVQVDEYLTYSYFLRTDADILNTHESSMEQPVAYSAYNTYKNTFINIGTKTVDLYIESKAELQELLEYSTQNGQLCLSVYIVPNVRGENFNHLSPTRVGEYVIYGASSVVF